MLSHDILLRRKHVNTVVDVYVVVWLTRWRGSRKAGAENVMSYPSEVNTRGAALRHDCRVLGRWPDSPAPHFRLPRSSPPPRRVEPEPCFLSPAPLLSSLVFTLDNRLSSRHYYTMRPILSLHTATRFTLILRVRGWACDIWNTTPFLGSGDPKTEVSTEH